MIMIRKEGILMQRLLFSVIAAAFLLTSQLASAQQAEAPTYKDGDKWRVRFEVSSPGSRSDTLRTGTYDVVYRGGKFLWFQAGKTDGEPVTEGLREEDAAAFLGKYRARCQTCLSCVIKPSVR